MRYELLIFDLDGTLVDSSVDLTHSTNHALSELGYPTHSREAVLRFVGDGARQLIERALPPEGRHRIDEALAIFREHYFVHVLDATRPFAGIEAVLDRLAAERLPLAICTNKPARFTAPIIEGLGWKRRFAAVLSGDEVARPKPDALPVTTICARLAVAPGRTLLIGDGTQDVGAARSAGAAICAALWGYTPRSTLEKLRPEHLAASPAEVPALLGL